MSKSKYLTFALLLAVLGCDDSDDDKKSNTKSSKDSGASTPKSDAGSKRSDAGGSHDDDDDGNDDPDDANGGESSGGNNDNGDVNGGESSDGKGSTDNGSAGSSKDAGTPVPDGGALHGSGSCCEEHDTPGCGNADLEVCVCEKLPSCCTTAWTKQCTFIVEQKYCQDGVRDCVCGAGDGQWGQMQCCDTSWNSACDSTAVLKCNAAQGCF